MSVKRFGNAGPEFGLVAETSGFVQDFNCRESYDEATAEDNIGEVQTYAMFNMKWEGAFTLIKKTGGTMPATGALAIPANLSECASVIITERDRKPEQKGFTKYSFSYKAFGAIN